MTHSPSTASADVPGIPLDAVEFYRALEESNSREWWVAQKERYAVSVREPMAHLGDVLTEEFGEPKLFRPHRDVRFSKDKSPYKNHQGLFVPTSARMGWYVQVGALVIGHVIGLMLAHDRALVYWPDYRKATASQYWMLAVMVAFTCFGLYLLSVANG